MANGKLIEQSLRDNNKHYFIQGLIFVILGVIALIVPGFVAELFAILLGILLVLAGLFQVWVSKNLHWRGVSYISALASIIAGVLIMFWPEASLMVLAGIVAVFLLIEGCLEIFISTVYAPFSGWVWMLLSGIITLVLAGLIFAGWPVSGVWFLGILIGINFIIFGGSLIIMSRYARRLI